MLLPCTEFKVFGKVILANKGQDLFHSHLSQRINQRSVALPSASTWL